MDSDKVTLDLLPYDCLVCIFSRIELKSQIQLSKVCIGFEEICTDIWRRNAEYQCLRCNLVFDLSTADLTKFLSIVKLSIKEVTLNSYFLHDFLKHLYESIELGGLSNVVTFSSEYYLDNHVTDEEVLLLSQLMPNLTTLRVMPALSGRYLTRFGQLQELYLYHNCEKEFELKKAYLPGIFEKLKDLRVLDLRNFELSNLDMNAIDKCKNLEVLKLNLNAMKPVLKKILSLPKLKTLTVLLDHVIVVNLIENIETYDYKVFETYEFYYILRRMHDKITGIAVDNHLMPLAEHWDENLDIFQCNKLKKFAFCNYILHDEMLKKYTSMRELRLLCCRNWPELTNETVLKLVVSCTKLEHLDVMYCNRIDEDFLHGAFQALREQGERRPLLTIYHSMSGIKDGIENHPAYGDWSTVMKLSTDLPPNSDRGLSYVQRGYEFDFE